MALELGKRDHEQRAMDRKGLIRIGTERYRISKKQVPQYGLKQKMLWADIWNIALGLGFGFWGYVIMHSFIIYVIMRSFIIYVIMEDSISFDDIS
jgi:hypothetical protein